MEFFRRGQKKFFGERKTGRSVFFEYTHAQQSRVLLWILANMAIKEQAGGLCFVDWMQRAESNRRPLGYEPSELTSCSTLLYVPAFDHNYNTGNFCLSIFCKEILFSVRFRNSWFPSGVQLPDTVFFTWNVRKPPSWSIFITSYLSHGGRPL